MDLQRFCVRWNSYKSNLQTAFPKLLTSEHFVDVTLACEKQFIKCHKIVLSACSVYFENLLVNNPCQHPIIFMKDVEFWEIKALVEFMYKGEVNVSQHQLDSLLKSAESLQIRGLSGTKQFVNFESADDKKEETITESKSKKNKSDNEDEEENVKKKKRKNEEEEKYIQITSLKTEDCASTENILQEVKSNEELVVKEEIIEEEEFEYDNTCINQGDKEEEGTEGFNQEAFYEQSPAMPGPSRIAGFVSVDPLPSLREYVRLKRGESNGEKWKGKTGDHHDALTLKKQPSRRSCYKQYTMANMWAALERIEQGLSVYRASLEYGVPRKTLRNWMKKYNIMNVCSLALDNVECVMDHDKAKTTNWAVAKGNCVKGQQRHQEHNYTNPPKDLEGTAEVPEVETQSAAGKTAIKPEAVPDMPMVEVYRTRSSSVKSSGGSGSGMPLQRTEVGLRPGPQQSSTAPPDRPPTEVKSRTCKKDVFNRIRRSEEELRKAADMVRNGMTFQTTSDTFNIPISTIRFYMARRGILPQRRRGRGSSGTRDDDLMHPPFEIIHYRLPDIDKPL